MRIGRMSEMIGCRHEYETHVTVRCADAAEPARLDAWAAARELKVTHIRLARGRMVSQPMLTLRNRTGHELLVPQLRAAGFDPVRVKVPWPGWWRPCVRRSRRLRARPARRGPRRP